QRLVVRRAAQHVDAAGGRTQQLRGAVQPDAHGAWQPAHELEARPRHAEQMDEVLVAAEYLVAALADEHDGDAGIANRACDEVHRQAGRIAKRLVELAGELGNARTALGGADRDLAMVATELRGDSTRERQVVKVLARTEAGEPDRERLERAVDELAHERDVRARVDSAAEQSADRDVAHHSLANRGAQQ